MNKEARPDDKLELRYCATRIDLLNETARPEEHGERTRQKITTFCE